MTYIAIGYVPIAPKYYVYQPVICLADDGTIYQTLLRVLGGKTEIEIYLPNNMKDLDNGAKLYVYVDLSYFIA